MPRMESCESSEFSRKKTLEVTIRMDDRASFYGCSSRSPLLSRSHTYTDQDIVLD